jgi:hypothetical protein
MSTQYRLVQSGKTASGGCSAGQGSSEPVVPRIKFQTLHELSYWIDVVEERVVCIIWMAKFYSGIFCAG